MSSGNLVQGSHPEWFTWSGDLDPAEYLRASYRISAACAVEDAARGMAMEQSAATVSIAGFVDPARMRDWTIRVRAIQRCGTAVAVELPAYTLSTEVYPEVLEAGREAWDIELAVPLRLLEGRPAQLLNVLVGELPRLGFLTSFRLLGARLPASFGPGPAFGAAGIRSLLGNPRGPLLCRSMRPAVGLATADMARLNREVLSGGFHLVKDDELACFPDTATFRAHLAAMLRARDEARERSGEPKLYLANLICEPWELEPRWNLAQELGVDGVLVAPFIQGLGVLPWLARASAMPVLAHNTFSDLLTRPAGWGIADTVLAGWLRRLGADWLVTPGAFGSRGFPQDQARAFLQAACGPELDTKPALPILQGGKHPADLEAYRDALEGHDFMLIVASWVDSHPEGLANAARLFRDVVDR